jgi:formylglycine-generating enzyme required for sulfatase activity
MASRTAGHARDMGSRPSEIDPTQASQPRWWLRSLVNPWVVAGMLVSLAISHGRFEFMRWSAMERARHELDTKRQVNTIAAKESVDKGALKRKGDEGTQGIVQVEVATVATPIAVPKLDPQPALASSTELHITVVPTLACDGAEAQVASERRCLRPKDTFKDCPECPEMVVVPRGEVMMGSQSQEEGRSGNEGPQHKVTIERQFAVSKFETTFEEWDACVMAGGCKHTPNDQGWGKGRRPVINVSWEDAKEYAAWLSNKTRLKYRLLKETEWEYAARANTITAFSTGETITSNDANFDGGYTFGGSEKGHYRKSTVEVGSFRPNAFGLCDMHGNVWEWVEDCWHADYKGGPGDSSAWTDRCNERARALRGGSRIDPPRVLRSASRSRNIPGFRSSTVGLRVARTLD